MTWTQHLATAAPWVLALLLPLGALADGRQDFAEDTVLAQDSVRSPPTPELHIEDALGRALEVAPRIHRSEAEREVADAGAGRLNSAYLPTAGVDLSLNRSRFPTTVTPIREPGVFPPLSDEIREAAVSLNWTVFDFGAGREERKAARALADAAQAGEAQARMETMEVVGGLYVRLAALDALEAAQRSRVDGIREQEVRMEALVEEGRIPRVDLLRMAELAVDAESDLRSTEREVQQVLESLARELALDHSLERDDVQVPELPDEIGRDPLDEATPAAGPSVEAAETRLEAARHEAREAYRSLLPRLEVVGRQSLRTSPETSTDRDWSVGVQLRIPLGRGDAVTGVRVREARERERAAELAQARASLEAAVEDLTAREADALARISSLDARIAHLVEAHRIELASYNEGRATLAEVLDTEARLAGARAERIGLVGEVLLGRLATASLTGDLTVPRVLQLLGGDG